jgi:hypothetical protein
MKIFIKSETDYWIHGFSGSTRVTQLASSRAIEGFLTVSALQVGMIRRPMCLSLFDWLCEEKNGKSLLVLENVDDARFLYDAPSLGQSGTSRQPLSSFLPQSQNRSILVTTRSREVALRLVEQNDIVEVEPMEEVYAVALFEKKLGKQGDSMDIAALAAALEFMLLAIVQVAAYIAQRASHCTVQQ